MPLVQLYVTTANNNTYFDVPIYGVCNIKAISVAYHKTNAVSTLQVVQIQSDKLISPASPLRFITFMNGPTALQTYDQGVGYTFDRVEMNGKIQIRLIDTITGATPADFSACLLTLQIDQA